METSEILQYKKKTVSSGSSDPSTDIWLELEQEDIPDNYDEVSLVDISGMMSKVMKGETAKAYISERCPYVTILGDEITVNINFYVWPCDQQLDYELTCDYGTIGPKMAMVQRRTRDVVFEGSNKEFLGINVLSAVLIPKMKVYNPFGKWLNDFVPSMDAWYENGYIRSNQKIYCVFDFSGTAFGYEHKLTMKFKKTDVEGGIVSISNFKNTVVASWYGENSEIETELLSIKLPGCVGSLLSTCDDGRIVGDHIGSLNPNKKAIVYYNECDGSKLGVKEVD